MNNLESKILTVQCFVKINVCLRCPCIAANLTFSLVFHLNMHICIQSDHVCKNIDLSVFIDIVKEYLLSN